MTDYRRIDANTLVSQARALGDLGAEIDATALRIEHELAAVGRPASSAAIADTAQWMADWATSMSQKAAIAATAVSMPAAPAGLPGGDGTGVAPGLQVVLKTVSVPRWIERPLLGVTQVTRNVTRAIAQTHVVQELRSTTELVLERVPITATVTRYREVQRTFTEWREVSIPQWVTRTWNVVVTEYRQIAQTVTTTVQIPHQVTNLIWNGYGYIAVPMTIFETRVISYTQYVSVPVQVTRTITQQVQQWVRVTLPITVTRTVIEPYQATVQTWVDRWVVRPIQQLVNVTKRVVGSTTTPTVVDESTAGAGGEWVYDERQMIEELPNARPGAQPAPAPREATPPTPWTAPSGAQLVALNTIGLTAEQLASLQSLRDEVAAKATPARVTGDAQRALNEVGFTAAQLEAFNTIATQERDQAARAQGGVSIGGALKQVAAITLETGLVVYDRAQQSSLGFFTADNPLESMQQAWNGATGAARYSTTELGFARLAEDGSLTQQVLAEVTGQLVDPATLFTAGAALPLRAATGAAIVSGTAAGLGVEALGGTAGQQEAAQIAAAAAAGFGAAAASAKQASTSGARAFETTNAARATETIADSIAAANARISELYGSPELAARAMAAASPGGDEAWAIAADLAWNSTHIEGSANRVMLGQMDGGAVHVTEAVTNGGIWYGSSEGVFEAVGDDGSWMINQTFLDHMADAGIGRFEFKGVDIVAETKQAADSAETPKFRVMENRHLADSTGDHGYVTGSGLYELEGTIPQPVAREVAGASATSAAASVAREQDSLSEYMSY